MQADTLTMNIRQARPDDAALLLNIYGPVVKDSTASFELTVPTVDEFSDRIASSIKNHEWVVMEHKDRLIGYAYATAHRVREAYKYSVETSVYIHADHRGQRIGKKLYESLFSSLQGMDFHNAYAGITLPNPGSVALHKSLGFKPIGVFEEIGFKHGSWHDVSWWQRKISDIAATSPAQ